MKSYEEGEESTKMNGIIRVFPKKNSYTPTDNYTFYGSPDPKKPLPDHKEIHISCTFTWDKAECEKLASEWEKRTNKPIKLGGPAFGSSAEDFQQGMYIKPNIIFTTRGCNNNCPWCIVPKLEGRLKELPIRQGNIIQDNNFLQASRIHKEKVFAMLRTQKNICFKGGLDVELIDDHFCDALQSLFYTKGSRKCSRISEVWLACDTDAALPQFKKAVAKLIKAGIKPYKISSYALIGDDMAKNEVRLREIYHTGAMPRAQLYRDFSDTKTEYDMDWRGFEKMWCRPAATKAHMKRGTDFKDFRKDA